VIHHPRRRRQRSRQRSNGRQHHAPDGSHPRIPQEFLAEERQALGDRWYRQEYECSFEATVGAVFRPEDIAACARDDVEVLDLGL
jgi:hypothetical protein